MDSGQKSENFSSSDVLFKSANPAIINHPNPRNIHTGVCGATLKSWWDFSKVKIKFQRGGRDLDGVSTVLLPEWHLSRGWRWLQGQQSAMAGATYLPPPLLILRSDFFRASSLPCGREATEAAPFCSSGGDGSWSRRAPVETAAGPRRRRRNPRGGAVDGRRVDAGSGDASPLVVLTTETTPAFPTTTVHATRRRGNQVSRWAAMGF